MGLFVDTRERFKNIWPRPPLGLDAIHDSLSPIPTVQQPTTSQRIPRNPRGSVFQGFYSWLNYATGQDRHVLPTLGRQYLYASEHGIFAVGGGAGYPHDYGYGVGYQGDCMTPQFYMRPGIPPSVQELLTGGRHI